MSIECSPSSLNVEKFVRFVSNTVKADKVSKTIGYGFGTLGHILSIIERHESDTSQGFKKLSSSISMARYVIRFTGGFESYEAAKNGSWCYDDDDKYLQRIVKLQAYSMLAYYPLENISYVGYIAPKLLKIDADKFCRWSCAMWTLYVVLDIYANNIRIRKIKEREKSLLHQVDIPVAERQTTLANLRKKREELFYVQLRNTCYFPTCLHWSVKGGVIPESIVQLLCFGEATIGLWRSWINTK